MSISISVHQLSFHWPDGTPVFDDLTGVFGDGKTGLIGNNGSGKSTLLRLIAGELTPIQGELSVSGDIGYVPQDLPLQGDVSVEQILGVSRIQTAIRVIEAGEGSERDFALVGD
ncbi:MAG: ATP-binding cassette domain-containing protein, partial [Terriglobales bacterium]